MGAQNLPDGAFERLADLVLSNAERFPDQSASWPPVQIQVAEQYVQNKVRLDRVPSLIQQGPHGEEVEIAARTWRPRFSARIFSVLGTMALLLTSAGVYGVVAYTTGQDPRGRNPRSARGQPARRIWCNASKCDDPLGRRSGRQPRGRLAVEPSVDERSL